MKNHTFNFKTNFTFKLLLVLGLFFIVPQQTEAQFFKKLAKKAKEKIDKEAEKRAEKRVNKKIDKEFDKAEDVLDGKGKKQKEGKEGNSNTNEKEVNNQNGSNDSTMNGEAQQANKRTVVWSKFDFVPGETVIYEDGPSADEENGEFPSRWDLVKGNAEIGNVDGENVIMFLQGGNIVPYLKNSNKDYLPEIFTIEFDVYFKEENPYRYWLSFYDSKNQSRISSDLEIYVNGLEMGSSNKRYPGTESLNWNTNNEGRWRHISVAFTKGKLKAYMDDTRLINIPHFEGNPTGLTIKAENNPEKYLKNFRIAKGGVKYYDRVLSEGKIIVNGIKFDVNKATLKTESMGPINEIYKLMVDNPTVNFSVEGHTDSDGDDDSNLSLSKARGKSVMNKLIDMGISSNRLKSTGFGESKPIDNNSTPEGKANNRRVEFVKFSGSSNNSSNTSNNSSSTFDSIDKKMIGEKLESLADSPIHISNSSGIVNGKGTIIIYATSDGNLGKMQILDIDKEDNYKLTLKYVTYNYNGSIHSQSNNLEVPGTYTCDLDKGNIEDVLRSDEDFWFSKADKTTTSIRPSETSILKILK
jgi:outer membrane protein OmpA-like peptidoglycan-associated protein